MRALAILSTVAGDALTRHLRKIIPAMLQAVDKSENQTAEEQVITHVVTVESFCQFLHLMFTL